MVWPQRAATCTGKANISPLLCVARRSWHWHHSLTAKASQSESLKTNQLSAMLTAKCRNTGHVVIMALIKQTWQCITGDHFNGLRQSCCYNTGKLRLCTRGKSKWLRWFEELSQLNRQTWSVGVMERGGQEQFWWYRGTKSKTSWDRKVVGYFPSSERFLSWQPLTTASSGVSPKVH